MVNNRESVLVTKQQPVGSKKDRVLLLSDRVKPGGPGLVAKGLYGSPALAPLRSTVMERELALWPGMALWLITVSEQHETFRLDLTSMLL